MIVTGAFIGPVAGESPMGMEKRLSSAKADAEMSVTIMMQMIFLMYCSPLSLVPRPAINGKNRLLSHNTSSQKSFTRSLFY